jgi:predicted membrane-bound mannosyltransferase
MISDQKRFDKSLNWAFLVTFAVAIVYRFWALDLKPPHFDEGINGWFTDQLISRGFYNYDPTNYHGPLHFYILMITKLLFGRR